MMHVKGDYNAVQDRILLSVWGGPTGKSALWLTRRQWLAIALSCKRVQAATGAKQNDGPRDTARQKMAGGKPEVEVRAALPDKTDDGYSSDASEDVKPSLVSKVSFQRLASGMRITLITEEEKTLFLPLKGENLSFFARLVERLAAKARWDFPTAMSRMKKAVPVQKALIN
jgi:hypothetical protein